jgi:hypothetical protein
MKHWPWQHQFEAVEVEHVIADYWGDGSRLKEGIGHRETLVLKRCACGKTKVTRLHGIWCLQQITGRANVSRQG